MKYLFIDLLRLYQVFVSPLFMPSCRFSPSCSEYAAQAIEKYGAMKGVWFGVKRLFRCQPLCNGGIDPVR